MAEPELTGTVAVEGLATVLQAFGRIDKRLGAELRGELRDVAEKAAQMAVWIAREKGLYQTGELIASIKAGARSSYAYITDTAKRVSPAYPSGFNYPAVYEYGGRGTSSRGPRAFLWPAAVDGQEALVAAVDQMLGRLTGEAGLESEGGSL